MTMPSGSAHHGVVEIPSGAPEWLEIVTAAERPDLWEMAIEQRRFSGVWPEYNLHGSHTDRYFGILTSRYADLQLLFVDRRSRALVARARTIPFHWDGTLEDLPAGIDAVGLRAVGESPEPTTLSALAAEVDPEVQGSGLSGLVIRAMASVARSRGLAALVAPVRPSWKSRYPLVPIERYAAWRREDGLPFDPWIRVHVRLGGRILRSEVRSMQIKAGVGDWESWTNMLFPEEGQYVFPGGLALLTIRGDIGEYYEPNVWVKHEVPRREVPPAAVDATRAPSARSGSRRHSS